MQDPFLLRFPLYMVRLRALAFAFYVIFPRKILLLMGIVCVFLPLNLIYSRLIQVTFFPLSCLGLRYPLLVLPLLQLKISNRFGQRTPCIRCL